MLVVAANAAAVSTAKACARGHASAAILGKFIAESPF
jgi:hypothetical protein